jgi:hypothetical protein
VSVPDRDHRLAALLDDARLLTDTRAHLEPYAVHDAHGTLVTRRHRTTVPGLLDQLDAAVEPSRSSAGAGARPGYGSSPAARLEALDVRAGIAGEVAEWLEWLRERPRPHAADGIGVLLAAAGTLDDEALERLAGAVRSWRIRAAVVTGWEAPAVRLHNTCPACPADEESGATTRRGRLRIRVEALCAACSVCGATWDESTIGVLAEHIRAENNDESAAA